MKKSELLNLFRAKDSQESIELYNKLIFLKTMFFNNSLNRKESDAYLQIHSEDALKNFNFSSKLLEKYHEFLQKNNSNRFDDIIGNILDTDADDMFGSLFGFNNKKTSKHFCNSNNKNTKTRVINPDGNLRRNNSIEKPETQILEEKDFSSSIILDPNKKYLCKYHHNIDSISNTPGNGFSEKRCPGCGKYYIELSESDNYVNSNNRDINDDENDIDYLQNIYNPKEKIYNDDGTIEYW